VDDAAPFSLFLKKKKLLFKKFDPLILIVLMIQRGPSHNVCGSLLQGSSGNFVVVVFFFWLGATLFLQFTPSPPPPYQTSHVLSVSSLCRLNKN
jgi:hypothetical protein